MTTKYLRRSILLLLLPLLLAACHRKADTAAMPADSIHDTVAATPAPTADTLVHASDTTHTPSISQKAVLHIDTAELTHLRIFGRKQKTFYSPRQLEGEWVLDDWHMHLDSNGHGQRWNPKEDITRDEPDRFNWTMDSNLLYLEFLLTNGAIVPKMYVVTFVDRESLVYQNAYGTAYMWDRPADKP